MEITRITIDEAKERSDRGEQLVFVDSRNPEAWAESSVKIPGAVRIPAGEVESHIDEIQPNHAIVTYCTCPNEESSFKVASELLDRGFKNVHPLYGGFDAWQKADYPVEAKEASSSRSASDH